MKLLLTLTAFFAVLALFAEKQKVKFNVNMHCEACQKKIEKNIAFEKGVKAMEVDLKTKTVAVTYDDKRTSPEKIIAGFKKIGYEATLSRKEGCCSQNKTAGCVKEGETGCKGNHSQGEEKKCCKESTSADKKCCSEHKESGDKKCTETTEKPCDKAKTAEKKCCSEAK